MQSRRDLETEADRLGVAWTHTTTDSELHSLIQSRLRGVSMNETTEAATAVQQEPNGQGNGEPSCHGMFWDYPKAKECKQCTGQHSCFQAFTRKAYPEMLEMLGDDASLEQLSKALDVSQEAVLVAKNEHDQTTKAPPVDEPAAELQQDPLEDESLEDPEVPESLEEPEVPESLEEPEMDLADAADLADELAAEAAEVEPEPVETDDMAAKKKKKAAVKKKSPGKKKAASKKAAAKKAPGRKKAAAKKPPKEVAPPEVQDPSPAESAKPVTDSVKSKAPAKNAPRAKGQADPTKGKRSGRVDDPWGKHTWISRWRKERKHPLVKKLRPGMKLRREYKGTTHEVIVQKRFYKYNGQEYPTLYLIVKEITGTQTAPRQMTSDGRRPAGTRELCNWSAPRFFALKALFSRP